MVLLMVISIQSLAGKDIGNGGSVVDNKPADFYYSRKIAIPPTGEKIDLRKHYPKMYEHLLQIEAFLNKRRPMYTEAKISLIAKYSKVYLTDKLSGDDPLPVIGDLEAKTITYSYLYESYDDTYTEKERFNVIEILKEDFEQLSPKHQALMILHENLHIKFPQETHEIISKFVSSISITMDLLNRQLDGDLKSLNSLELSSSLTLQNILHVLYNIENNLSFTISTLGGGAIYKQENVAPESFDSIFVSADSVLMTGIKFTYSGKGVYYDNEVLDLSFYTLPDPINIPGGHKRNKELFIPVELIRQQLEGTQVYNTRVKLHLQILATLVNDSDYEGAERPLVVTHIAHCKSNIISNAVRVRWMCAGNNNQFSHPKGVLYHWYNTYLSTSVIRGDDNIVERSKFESVLINGYNNKFVDSDISDSIFKTSNFLSDSSQIDSLQLNNAQSSFSVVRSVIWGSAMDRVSLKGVTLKNSQLYGVIFAELPNNLKNVSGLNLHSFYDKKTRLYFKSLMATELVFNSNYKYDRLFKSITVCFIICNGKSGPRDINILSVTQFESEYARKYLLSEKCPPENANEWCEVN